MKVFKPKNNHLWESEFAILSSLPLCLQDVHPVSHLARCKLSEVKKVSAQEYHAKFEKYHNMKLCSGVESQSSIIEVHRNKSY